MNHRKKLNRGSKLGLGWWYVDCSLATVHRQGCCQLLGIWGWSLGPGCCSGRWCVHRLGQRGCFFTISVPGHHVFLLPPSSMQKFWPVPPYPLNPAVGRGLSLSFDFGPTLDPFEGSVLQRERQWYKCLPPTALSRLQLPLCHIADAWVFPNVPRPPQVFMGRGGDTAPVPLKNAPGLGWDDDSGNSGVIFLDLVLVF